MTRGRRRKQQALDRPFPAGEPRPAQTRRREWHWQRPAPQRCRQTGALFNRPGEMRVQHRSALGAPHGADDAFEAIAVRPDEMLRRITKAETQQHRHGTSYSYGVVDQPSWAIAASHSSRTARSDSAARRGAAHATRRSRSSRPSAHMAAPRISGAGSSQQSLGFMSKRAIARVADRNQHIAEKARAADAFDRTLAEQRAERRVIEPRKLGKQRRTQCRRVHEISSHGRLAQICSRDRPQGNRRSHRCGCP